MLGPPRNLDFEQKKFFCQPPLLGGGAEVFQPDKSMLHKSGCNFFVYEAFDKISIHAGRYLFGLPLLLL